MKNFIFEKWLLLAIGGLVPNNLQRNYDILKSENPCFFLNKNINFNKNAMKSKMENPTNSFRKTNLMLQLMQE